MPARGSTKPEAAKLLTREQVATLLRGPKEAGALRDYYLLAAAYYLCRRIGETILLQPRHFANLEMDEVTVPILKRLRKHRCAARCKDPCPMKGKARWPHGLHRDDLTGLPLKTVPVLDGKRLLSNMVSWAGPRRWMFPGRAGGHLKARRAETIFRTWADAAGLARQVTSHSLRHTATTFAVESGGIAVGRDLAAHASIATTDRYTHTTKEALARARGSLSAQPKRP